MGMTMTEKILARGAGKETVVPGDLLLAKVDFAMGHDLTIPPAGRIMREQMGAEKIWDPDRVAVTQDHFQPAKDAASATLGRLTREFSQQMGIKWYFEVGQGGICHTVLPENGLVLPGELVVGADSHSCTYGALNNFATGIGSTDLACVLALGELWFRVPETLKFVYHNRLKEWVEAKDLILYVIGQIGVDGARSKAMEHTGEALRYIDPTPPTKRSSSSTRRKSSWASPSRCPRTTTHRFRRSPARGSTRFSSARAPTRVSPICAARRPCSRATRSRRE